MRGWERQTQQVYDGADLRHRKGLPYPNVIWQHSGQVFPRGKCFNALYKFKTEAGPGSEDYYSEDWKSDRWWNVMLKGRAKPSIQVKAICQCRGRKIVFPINQNHTYYLGLYHFKWIFTTTLTWATTQLCFMLWNTGNTGGKACPWCSPSHLHHIQEKTGKYFSPLLLSSIKNEYY